jgi:signal transduction histidine kinase
MINDTVQLNRVYIKGKDIHFETQVDPFVPARFYGDELRIKQILNNLLSNAFKYTQSGKVTLKVSSFLEQDNKNATLELSVRDTGYGMSKEQLSALFDEYSRFGNEMTQIIEGTGLGLAITKSLVNLMNGSITVESEMGKGTVFTARIPQKPDGSDTLGEETAKNIGHFHTVKAALKDKVRITREPMPYGAVLVVDDVEPNL